MTPAGQRWTKEKPTEPGWYWWRTTKTNLEPIEIIIGMDGKLWVKLHEASYIPVEKMHGEWQGPLTPNEAME